MLCTAEVFEPQIAALWPHCPVMIASTLDGDTIGAMAASILAAAPPRFALAGISMGGHICLEIMRQAPDRVARLALLNTAAHPDTPEQAAQRRALVVRARGEDFESFLKTVMRGLLHPVHQADTALLHVLVRMGLTVGLEGMARQTEAIAARVDSHPILASINVPTIVLAGDSDPLVPLERTAQTAEAIPGAQLVIVPQCGHGSTLEQPEAVNRALLEWLAAGSSP
jgi:pimeloyl-ACP methyl ester carboxylesterase